MKPHLLFARGMWWIGPVREDYFLWACCATSVREVCALWSRCLPNSTEAEAVSSSANT